MRRVYVSAVVVALLGLGCLDEAVCGGSTNWCEGDVRVSCTIDCRGGGKLETDCERRLTRKDCALEGQSSGVPKTCREWTEQLVVCVDAPLAPCGSSSEPSSCDSSGRMVRCQETESGSFRVTSSCGAGKSCYPGQTGVFCADSPPVSCDPLLFPRCGADGRTRLGCDGRPDAGYVLSTWTCPNGCVGGDGGVNGYCR
jgi:hypothetical protein